MERFPDGEAFLFLGIPLKSFVMAQVNYLTQEGLDKLKEEHLWQSGELKAYHSRLTDIVREYIEHRFQIHTLERTSDEVLDSFKNAGLSNKIPFESLQQLLYQADRVKFAKGKPQPEDNVRSLEQAYDFVKQTLKQEKEMKKLED